MTSHKGSRIVWQVQSRMGRKQKWYGRGRFKTRSDARLQAIYLRDWLCGFGNTRVIRIEVPHRAKKEVAA